VVSDDFHDEMVAGTLSFVVLRGVRKDKNGGYGGCGGRPMTLA